MYSNYLLEEKWKAQEKLAREANYQLSKMIDNADKTVLEIEKRTGIKFKKVKINQ